MDVDGEREKESVYESSYENVYDVIRTGAQQKFVSNLILKISSAMWWRKVVCWQLAEAGNVENVRETLGRSRACSISIDVDTIAVEIISLTVITTLRRWKGFSKFHIQHARANLSESSTQAAVRQLHFNEWRLTELWQRTLNRWMVYFTPKK